MPESYHEYKANWPQFSARQMLHCWATYHKIRLAPERLEQSERTIKELLQALKGKKRERLDPNQLLLF